MDANQVYLKPGEQHVIYEGPSAEVEADLHVQMVSSEEPLLIKITIENVVFRLKPSGGKNGVR